MLSLGAKYSMALEVGRDCHRTVVLLTPEIFGNDDKIFEVQTVRPWQLKNVNFAT